MRDAILGAIRANRPAARPHPGTAPARDTLPDAEARFAANAQLSASRVVPLAHGESLAEVLAALHPELRRVTHRLNGEPATSLDADARWTAAPRVDAATDIATLAGLQLAVLPAALGVIENGACWVGERAMGHRALPFSTEHLVLTVPRANLVETMHEAYARVRVAGDFGVFIAGPSKTADIEQSLVIGAQGPRSLTVILT